MMKLEEDTICKKNNYLKAKYVIKTNYCIMYVCIMYCVIDIQIIVPINNNFEKDEIFRCK